MVTKFWLTCENFSLIDALLDLYGYILPSFCLNISVHDRLLEWESCYFPFTNFVVVYLCRQPIPLPTTAIRREIHPKPTTS